MTETAGRESIAELRERPNSCAVADLPEWLRRYASAVRHRIDPNLDTVADYLDRAATEIETLLPAPTCKLSLQVAPAAPPGWRLVPVDPTPPMLVAGIEAENAGHPRAIYDAMLAAAPTPPEPARHDHGTGCRRCCGWGHRWVNDQRVTCDLCNGSGTDPSAARHETGRPTREARRIVNEHQLAHGNIHQAEELIEKFGTELGFAQLAATPHTRDIGYGPTDEECAVACMLVSKPHGKKQQDGWQKRVNDVIRALQDERNALREAIRARRERGMSETYAVTDPFIGKTVEVSSKLTDRLRGRYASGPTLPNGEPEFGWRQYPTSPIQIEPADALDAKDAEIAKLRAHIEEIEAAYNTACVTAEQLRAEVAALTPMTEREVFVNLMTGEHSSKEWMQHTLALAHKCDAAERVAAEALEALRPFAEAAAGIPDSKVGASPACHVTNDKNTPGTITTLLVRDFRQAAAAIRAAERSARQPREGGGT